MCNSRLAGFLDGHQVADMLVVPACGQNESNVVVVQ